MGRGQGNEPSDAVRPRGRPKRQWTDERIRAALEPICAGRRFFPTAREIVRLAGQDLASAVQRHGGTRYWAQVFGLDFDVRQGRAREPYGAAEAVADVRVLIRKLGYLPGSETISASGNHRLGFYLRRNGGARAFLIRHRDELYD